MSKGHDNFGSKILHRLAGFIRERSWRCCDIFHGAGSVEVNMQEGEQWEALDAN